MVTRDGKQLARESKETCQIAKPEAKHKVSPLRKRMISDMELAGFTGGTQQTYIGAVVKLQDHYNIRPDRLSEKQVQQYVLWLRDEKRVAKGTFQTSWYGLRFFYYRTLGVDWSLRTLREKLIKIGAKVVKHSRYVVFQMAEVIVPRALFREILERIQRLRFLTIPARPG